MGLFDRILRLFVKVEPEIQTENSQSDIVQEEYENKYQGNSQKISADAMDTLLLDDEEDESPVEPVIVSEYDAGDVDFDEFNNTDNEDNSDKNVVVHESYDDLDEYLAGAEVIGDIPGEVLFDSDKS
ncbi:MAG: hypothetical protein CBC92_006335 [Euryarchaeota archaeon TMED132]|nr:hypothetical protein [Euryarchaeota archaeon]RAH04981.1 MAG: hypothetical protein CBC92_006335 [Euryarchaeota archaeon TMED132]|tara:strand:- start:7842 stop:8222 length:381 start_codon:yes stop_codon:yes gene_type:complete